MNTALRASLLAAAALPLSAQRPAIMVTGYWPPTNESVRHFSTDPVLNPGGWLGSDWEARGYDVHSYFPTFSPASCGSCGAGSGLLTVDYQDTSIDFWQLANALKPIAIVTFSRATSAMAWEVEMNQYNRSIWFDDYIAPTQPTPVPPDNSMPPQALRLSTLPVNQIVAAVAAASLPVHPYVCFSGNGGGFLSEFIAYHGVWYQALHQSPTDPAWCIAAGHVHVGGSVSWTDARTAAEITLRQVIAHVDGVRAATLCHQDIGYQGPGTASLLACGGSLALPGNSADMRVLGAAPNSIGILAIGRFFNPTPLLGGTLVPVPFFLSTVVSFDAQGQWFLPAALHGTAVPVGRLVAQIAYLDAALPQQWGFTNALCIVYQ